MAVPPRKKPLAAPPRKLTVVKKKGMAVTSEEIGSGTKKRVVKKPVAKASASATKAKRSANETLSTARTLTPELIKHKFPDNFAVLDANIEVRTLDNYTDEALFNYGSYVVENRAIPDLRDGLKPSHRAMLWSAIGHRPGTPFAKSARVVGKAIGEFHPHGDTACYEAGVTIANANPPLLEGKGNFGSPVDPAAAMRYSEMRMSQFSHLFMLDSGYLKAVPMVDNFSLDTKWPLYVPALLPTLLLAGNPTIPAYGVSAGNPSFELKGVADIVLHGLMGKEITTDLVMKHLKVAHRFGTKCIDNEAHMKHFYGTGKGSLHYEPDMHVDYKTKRIIIQNYVPRTMANAASTAARMQEIAAMKGVSSVSDSSSSKNPLAGPYACAIEIEVGRGVGEDAFYDLARAIQRKLNGVEAYDLGVVVRYADQDKKTRFARMNFAQFFRQWIIYRVNLETRYLNVLLEAAQSVLHVLEGKIKVCASKQALDRAIHLIRTASDPKAALMKEFKLSDAQTEAILSTQLRSLAKLALEDLKNSAQAKREEIKDINGRIAAPGKSAAADLKKRLATYLKKPDLTVSGIPVMQG